MSARSSTCSWVSMPRDAATLMSTASRIAATPSRIWVISRASGPRTAATMQNSVAPVAAVSFAACTSDGMSSQAARTGDCEQPGLRAEVAVLGAAAGLDRHDALDLDLGAAPAQPHLVGEGEQVGQRLVGQLRALRAPAPRRARGRPRAPGCGRSRGSAQWWSARRKSAASKVPPRAGARPARAASRNSGGVQGAGAGRQGAGERPGGERLEVAHVAAAGQVRLGGPRADHDPGEGEAAVCHRLQRQRGVVEGAECRVGDDQDGRGQRAGEVGDGGAFLVVPHQQAAGALDQDQVPVVGERARPCRRWPAGPAGARPRAGRRRRGRAGRGTGRARAGR